jgi:hypothetical protein
MSRKSVILLMYHRHEILYTVNVSFGSMRDGIFFLIRLSSLTYMDQVAIAVRCCACVQEVSDLNIGRITAVLPAIYHDSFLSPCEEWYVMVS